MLQLILLSSLLFIVTKSQNFTNFTIPTFCDTTAFQPFCDDNNTCPIGERCYYQGLNPFNISTSLAISQCGICANDTAGNISCSSFPFCEDESGCFDGQTCDTTNIVALAYGCDGVCQGNGTISFNFTTSPFNCTMYGYCDLDLDGCAADEYCDTSYADADCGGYCMPNSTSTTMYNCTMYDYECDENNDDCGEDEYCYTWLGNCGECMSIGMDTTMMANCTMYGYCDLYGDISECEDDEYCDGSYASYENCGMCMSVDMDTTMDMDMDTTDDSMENMGTTDSMEEMGTTDSMEDMGTTDSMEDMGTTDDSMEDMGTTDSMDGMTTTDDDTIVITIPEAACTFSIIISTVFGAAVYGFM